MNSSLLREFKEYLEIKKGKIDIKDYYHLTPTISLPLMISENVKLESENIKEIDSKFDNSIEITNDLLENLNVPKHNVNSMKFIFYELISNIHDHSEFKEAFLMGESIDNNFEFTFLDNGITIPQSFKNNNFEFEDACDAIIKAINGLSTKNELGYIERGTGLNNCINIIKNGFEGSILLVSGYGLIHITPKIIESAILNEKYINGTMISIKMDLRKNIDFYKYLNQKEYTINKSVNYE